MRSRAWKIRRKFGFPSCAVFPLFYVTTAVSAPLLFRSAPVLQGNCCSNALPRMENPAQVWFSVVCGFSVVLRNNRSVRRSSVVRRRSQGSCYTCTLARAVSPAQTWFPVIYGSSVILRNNRKVCTIIIVCRRELFLSASSASPGSGVEPRSERYVRSARIRDSVSLGVPCPFRASA